MFAFRGEQAIREGPAHGWNLSISNGSSFEPWVRKAGAYDLPDHHLVLAPGASTNDRLIPGLNALTIKTMADARVLGELAKALVRLAPPEVQMTEIPGTVRTTSHANHTRIAHLAARLSVAARASPPLVDSSQALLRLG